MKSEPPATLRRSPLPGISFHPRIGDGRLAQRLREAIEGEVLFDRASRGRYSTDASIYQIDASVE